MGSMVDHNKAVYLRCADGKSLTSCLGIVWQITALRDIYRSNRNSNQEITVPEVTSPVLSEMLRLLEPYKRMIYKVRTHAQLRRTAYPTKDPLVLELKKLTNDMFEDVLSASNKMGCYRLRDACCIRIIDALYGQSQERVRQILRTDGSSRQASRQVDDSEPCSSGQ